MTLGGISKVIDKILKENVAMNTPKQKVILVFLVDTSISGSTNDIFEILDPTNFDIPEHFRKTR